MDPTTVRAEHSRSLDDAERFRALETLTEMGLLTRMSDMETFHGRVAPDTEVNAWRVDPAHPFTTQAARIGNANQLPSLYTGSEEDARAFAEDRRSERGLAPDQVQIHDIVSSDPDARIIDLVDFDQSKLSEADRERYQEALRALVIPLSVGSPVPFEHRGAGAPFMTAFQAMGQTYHPTADLPELMRRTGLPEEVAAQLLGGANAMLVAYTRPELLAKRSLDFTSRIGRVRLPYEGREDEYHINGEYVANYLRANHIVGVRILVDSASLGRRLPVVALIDLDRVATKEQLQSRRDEMTRRLGALAAGLGEATNDWASRSDQHLLQVLMNAYATPRQLVNAAREVDGYDAIYNASTGNSEGFLLGEHTETVLRNIDSSYADGLPVEWLAPLRLAALSHDLGKPEAAAANRRDDQQEYNLRQAADFFAKLGIEDRMSNLLLAVIGEGEALADAVIVRGAGEAGVQRLQVFAREQLQRFYGTDEITDAQVDGFVQMCVILQICDGGAYTSMAVTHGPNGAYRNYPSFNATFAMPTDPGRHRLRLWEQGSMRAPQDLAPHTK